MVFKDILWNITLRFAVITAPFLRDNWSQTVRGLLALKLVIFNEVAARV